MSMQCSEKYQLLALAVSMALLSGCNSSSDTTSSTGSGTTPTTGSGTSTTATDLAWLTESRSKAMVPIQSDSRFEALLKGGLQRQQEAASATITETATYLETALDMAATTAPVAMPVAAADSSAAGATTVTSNGAKSVSSTNLQEMGVDEMDIVKVNADGSLLYVIQRPGYPVMPMLAAAAPKRAAEVTPEATAAMPAVDSSIAVGEPYPYTPPDYNPQNQLLVYTLTESPPGATLVKSLPIGLENQNLNGLYLDNNRLVAVYGDSFDLWRMWWSPMEWQQKQSRVEIYSLANPQAPQLESTIILDGQMVTSRRIGDTLYLASRMTPYVDYYYYPYPIMPLTVAEPVMVMDAAGNTVATDDSSTATETLATPTPLEQKTLAELLPKITINQAAAAPLAQAADCYAAPVSSVEQIDASIVSLTAISISNPTNWRNTCFIGSSEALYLSTQSAYFATAQADYSRSMQDSGDYYSYYAPDWTTLIHQFSLDGTTMSYVGSGEVTGHLGWDEGKKPFRMGEFESAGGRYLGIVTSEGETWDSSSKTRLTLLKSNGGGELQKVKEIPDLGLVGEELYAARFLGSMAYLVTFKTTDPLYAIPLTDPENLTRDQIGDLKVDGYSDYLHPISGGYLLGIGKDAVVDSSGTGDENRGAFYQGVKLSLFDVRDPKNMRELSKVVLGKRGSESSASHDHHAITWLNDESGGDRMGRLALPVQVNETAPSATDYYPGYNPSAAEIPYNWSHTGLYQFEVVKGADGVPALVEKSPLIIESATSEQSGSNSDLSTHRSVIVNDAIHYVHDAQVTSAVWGE